MAQTLTISNTSGTVNLISNANATAMSAGYFIDYMAKAGPDLSSNATVDETSKLHVIGTSKADLSARIGSIQRILWQAQNWQATKSGPRTFVNWQPDGYGAAFRSELVTGAYVIDNDTWQGAIFSSQNRAILDLSWTRRNWWEGAEGTLMAGVPIPYGLPLGTSNTMANSYDIAGTSILGDLPAPTMIRSFFSSGPYPINWSFTIARSNEQLGTAGKPYNIFESFASGGVTWTQSPSGNWSGSANGTISLATGTAITLNNGSINTYASFQNYVNQFGDVGMYRFYLWGTASGTVTTKITPWILETTTSNYIYWPAQYVNMGSCTFDLGLVKFPSNAAKVNTYDQLDVGMTVTTGGTYLLDTVQIMRTDAYRYYYGPVIATHAYMTDDNLDGNAVFMGTSTTNRMLDIPVKGDPIYLVPNMWHRLYVNYYGTGWQWATGGQQITMIYRPRYLNL